MSSTRPANTDSGNFDFRVGTGTQDTGGTALAVAYTHATKVEIDNTSPTVVAGSSGYYQDAALTTAVTHAKAGTDIYVKFTFSENMQHAEGDVGVASNILPFLAYDIGDGGAQFDVVGHDDALSSGDCRPDAAPPADVYECRYTVANDDSPDFLLVVGARIPDVAGNSLLTPSNRPYRHATKVVIDNTPPQVVAGSSGYYKDAALTTTMTHAKAGADIYVKFTFSENMRHAEGDVGVASNILPFLAYDIGDDSPQFDVVGHDDALSSGDCRPDTAPPADVYECRYTVANDDSGDFLLVVGARIPDLAGNPLLTPSNRPYRHATKVAIDNTAPTFVSAAVSGSALTVTFSENMDTSAGAKAAKSAFAVTVAGSSRTVNSYTLSGKTATLTLASAVTAGQSVTVAYTKPTGSNAKPLADLVGNELASFSNTLDTVAPTVTAASSGYFEDAALTTALTGPVGASTDIYVKVVFSEDVGHLESGTGTARPQISYQIGDATAVQFHIVADTATLDSGDCRPDDATDRDTYECRYTTTSSDSGDFEFIVGTATQDTVGNALASTYTHASAVNVDTTAPTVSSAAYYSDAALSASLTGTVKSGNDVYTKVTFSEKVGHTVGDGDSARPEINYTVGSTETQYDVVANTATLASGDCQPSAAPPASVYVCYYKVGGTDSGALGFEVDTNTKDEAGNALASAWTPSTTLTLEPAPLFSTTIADQSYTVNTAIDTLTLPAATGGDANTTLTYTLTPTLPTGLTFSATDRTITGTPSATSAETEYTYTVTETDNDSASLTFKITVTATDTTAPTVTFSPANAARTNAKSADLTLTFDEAVYKDASQGEFGASDLESLIELKVTDDNGNTIGFSASINDANTIVTINPSSNLADGKVYVEVGSGFYDAAGNQGAETSATFTVDTGAPTYSSATVSGSTLTVTFSENMDTSAGAKAAKSAFAVTVAGNSRAVNSYTLSDKTAALALASAVTAGQTVTVAYTKPGGSDAKLQDLAGNDLASFSRTLDTTAPTVTAASSGYFEDSGLATPLTGPVKASTDIYVKVTFSEDVGHVVSDLAAARPEISHQIGDGTAVQFHVVAPSATLASGDCRPDHATDRDTYECLYTAASGDNGDFDFTVGTNTRDGANNALAQTYTHSAKVKIDTTAPTVSSAAYYSDAALATSLTGTVKSGNDVYTEVTFSEKVGHTVGDGDSARPEINYTVGSTETQYDVVANTATLASGDCKPNAAPPATVYVCYYKVGGTDSGALGFEVDTNTKDEAGNALASAWTPSTTLTLEPAPLFSTTIADQSYTVNTQITTLTLPAATGGDAGTTLTYTLTPTLPTGLAFSGTNRTITGTPSATSTETEYTYTVTETDNDSASLTFKITVAGDGSTPTFSSATVNGATLTVTFSKALDTSWTPGVGAFTLDGGAGSDAAVSSYTLSGATATLVLSEPVIEGATVKLSYVKPTGANATPLQDAQGNAVPNFNEQAVTNKTDTTRPTVSFRPANATHTNDADGDITLTFSEAVYSDASGATFTDAAAARLVGLRAAYVDGTLIPFSASMTTTGDKANQVLTINPTGDLSDGYVYVDVGRGYFDAAGNDGAANLMAFTVDTVAPEVSSAAVDGATLTVTFSETLKSDETDKADKSAFKVTVAGSARSVSSYTLTGRTAILTLASAVTQSQAVTVAYTKPGSGTVLEDLAGNALATILSADAVSVANSTGNTAPTVLSAAVNGATLTVTFSEALEATSIPATGAFSVGASRGTAPTVSTVTLSSATATLTLSSAVDAKQRLTLRYTKPSDANAVVLEDPDANAVASFALRVKNQTTDTTAPEVSSAVVNGTTLTVTFSEDMDATSMPAASAFAVDVTGTSDDPTVSAYTLAKDTATLTLSVAVKAGKTATLTYTKPTGSNAKPLKDLAGNDLAPIPANKAVSVTIETIEEIVLNKTSLAVAEGGSATFTVALSASPPTDVGNVTVRLTIRNGVPAEVDKRRLTFTTTTWNTAQTVTVSGLTDANKLDDPGVMSLIALGGQALVRRSEASLPLMVTEAASATLAVSPSSLDIPEEKSATLSVRLSKLPTADVTVSVAMPSSDALSADSASTLSFTPSNWNVEQGITFSALADADGDRERVTVTLTASGGNYDGKSQTVEVVADDDEAPAPTAPTATLTALDADNATVATAGEIPVDGKLKVTFGEAVGICSRLTDAVCPTDVTAWTTISSAHAAKLFELVRVGWLDTGETRNVPFTVAVSGNDVTLTPTGLTATVYEDEKKRIRLVVRDKYWSVESGMQGASSMATYKVTAAAGAIGTAQNSPSNQGMVAHLLGQDLAVTHVSGTVTGCLDVEWGAAKNGQDVQTWTCNGTKAQTWRLEQRSAGAEAGRYRLVSGVGDGASYCLDNRGDFSDSARMGIWSCVGDTHSAVANQSFDLASSGNGWTLTFTRGNASSVLWAERPNDTPKGNVGQRSGDTGARAEWQIGPDNTPQPVVVAQAAFSVADASVTEAAGAALAFTVLLDRAVQAADGTVSVNYATRDVTATAGADYTAASGILTFAVGEQQKTVNVTVLEDAHDDGGETLELVLSNAVGASITDGTGTGTIDNSDPMPQAWLARFGRAVAEQVLDGVRERLEAPRTPGQEASLAGQTLDFSGPMAADEVAALAEVARQFDGSADPMAIRTASEARAGEGSEMRDLTTREALLGTSFTLTGDPDPDNGGSLAFWGRVAQSRFEGQDGALKLDGELTTGLLGADYGRNGWLAGLLVSRSSAKGGYDSSDGSGALESTLTAATAYGALAMSPRLTLWGAAGLGSGDLTLTPAGGDAAEAGLDWRLAAVGLRSSLIDLPAAGGLGLALVSDALWTQTASDQTTGLSASKADVTRLRLGLEGSWAVRLQRGGSLTPKLELGLRHDDGDAERGLGVELGGGIAWSLPGIGLTLDLTGRALLAHAADGLEDHGFSAALVYDPRPETERGVSLSLRQDVGGSSAGGVEALFASQTQGGQSLGGGAAGGRLAVEAAWGLPVFGGGFTGSPHVGYGLTDDGRDYSLGWRLAPAGEQAPALSLEVKATRRERQNDGSPVDHAVGIEITGEW